MSAAAFPLVAAALSLRQQPQQHDAHMSMTGVL